PDHLPIANKRLIQRLFHHLYALKLVLAASLVDRMGPESPERGLAVSFLEKYLPSIEANRPVSRRIIQLGRQSTQQSEVVFGLPQLNDLFDVNREKPQRAQPLPPPPPPTVRPTSPQGPNVQPAIKITSGELEFPNDEELDLFVWQRIKIDP
ncbi:MAG: hypothetical protein AAF633_13450, partial [Chloroflexota bacterium]